MGEGNQGQRDLVLAPNVFAYISDETKGNINTYVGPFKTSLAGTDKPVIFDDRNKKFVPVSIDQAVQLFAIAPEGWYIILKNPADKAQEHPKTGTVNNSLPDLLIGRKVNIPGPCSFPLWPGQMRRIIKGHHLHSNQYLLVRVYDEEAAKANWSSAVVKKQGEETDTVLNIPDVNLTMGSLLIIQGTEVSFYIPPTGIEVVPDDNGDYVRDAITLERLEYCILLDEDGNKRFTKGPAVVFPKPTETFVERRGARKFKAIELNEISGLYIKVIADYTENGNAYKVGDELFITGKDQMVYFPREEHAIIKYGDRTIHYAVAIPAGEARYVLNRLTGEIALERGPQMLLPDPRKHVIIRRVLDGKTVNLWFPGNTEAMAYNMNAQQLAGVGNYISDVQYKRGAGQGTGGKLRTPPAAFTTPANFANRSVKAADIGADMDAATGDSFNRNQTFTQPRSITLDTKYEGAVTIDVWTGYAVLVKSKTGAREVVVGPAVRLLEYDEVLEAMELSTGNPKNTDALLKTVYLRVQNNKISDTITAETKDLCKVGIKVSYRVDFTGAPEKWFEVENYVKYLTDHLRSIIRNVVKQRGIEEFYGNNVAILRDTILGAPEADKKRPGKLFEDNGMLIKDVEILDVTIGDGDVRNLLVSAQKEAVRQTIEVGQKEEELVKTKRLEAVKREMSKEMYDTVFAGIELNKAKTDKTLELELAQIAAQSEKETKAAEVALAALVAENERTTLRLEQEKATEEQELAIAKERQELKVQLLAEEVNAVVKKIQAVSPNLVAALQAFGDKEFAGKVATALGPLAIMEGDSVATTLAKLTKGLPLGTLLEKLNGTGTKTIE